MPIAKVIKDFNSRNIEFFLSISFISVFVDKMSNCSIEHINYSTTKFRWKHILALNDILKRKLQINSFIYNIYLCRSSYKDVFPHRIVKCFEKIIVSDKNYWNNCKVVHVTLKLHTPTGWFIALSMTVAQLIKHFRSVIGR